MSEAVPFNKRKSGKKTLDYYPTPPWGTRALLEFLAPIEDLGRRTAWEPACGAGYMARPMAEYFQTVTATDIADRSAEWPGQDGVADFLLDWPDPERPEADWIITNPPFNMATEFVELALARARRGVAMFLKLQILEGITRYREIYSFRPPAFVLIFSGRIGLCENRIDPDASTNQPYIWTVWITDPALREAAGLDAAPRLHWIPPEAKRLERPGDYRIAPPEADPLPAPLLDRIAEGGS